MAEPVRGRLRWRPGVHVVRRDAAHLQVGIDPPRRAVVPDRPAVRAALRALPALDRADPEARAVLRALCASGLVLEGPAPASTLGTPELRRAAEAQFGDDAARRLEARRSAGVAVLGEQGHRTAVLGLLRAAAVGLVGDGEAPAVSLLVTAGEPPRAEVDPLVREGAPHLLVRLGAVARVGPFVLPGRTACLRCVDAHLAEPDPRRPLVVEQVAAAARAAGDVPVDPTLATLALAWAVRDLTRYVEGDRPATWSAVVEIDHAARAVHTEWARHPHCGCTWDVVC